MVSVLKPYCLCTAPYSIYLMINHQTSSYNESTREQRDYKDIRELVENHLPPSPSDVSSRTAHVKGH